MSEQVLITLITVIGGTLVKGWFDRRSFNKELLNEVRGNTKRLDQIELTNKEMAENVKGNNQANRALLRNKLKRGMSEAFARGFETFDTYDEMAQFHDAYKVVGGNGAIDDMWHSYQQLPKRKGEEQQ